MKKWKTFPNTNLPCFLLGDFNAVFDRHLDRSSSHIDFTHRDTSDKLRDLFSNFSVNDAWRIQHPTTKSFSWTRPDGTMSSRIDLVGVPVVWSYFCVSSHIVPCPHSDHCAVTVHVNIPSPVKKGPSFWKLNVSILEDEAYSLIIRNFWTRWVQKKASYTSLSLWWDRGKQWLRSLSISYCSSKARARRLERASLEKMAAQLKLKLDAGDSSVLVPYKRTLHNLSALDHIKAEGLRVRSRIQHAEEGESSTSFFFKSIQKKQSDNTIYSVKNNAGLYVSSSEDMLTAWQQFYSELFTTDPTDDDLQNILLRQLESKLDPFRDRPLRRSSHPRRMFGCTERDDPE